MDTMYRMPPIVHMPLAEAKAHLSELVDRAEFKGKRVIILRHGKPAAALVPISAAVPERAGGKPATDEEASAFFADAAHLGDLAFPAVSDLLQSRR